MAKLNEGDVMEGIFCLALALYIAEGRVDKSKLNKFRKQIEPSRFASGRQEISIAEGARRKKGSKPVDEFDVQVDLRLKTASTTGAFGKDWNKVYYSRSRDIGNIDKKIDQLIAHLTASAFIRQVNTLTDRFLNNNKRDRAVFVVTADGIEGEASGGTVKGDVNLSVYALTGGKRVPIKGGTVPFSIKSESVTMASLSPYHGMLELATKLGVKWDAKDKYARLAQPFKGPTEQRAKFRLIEAMYSDLQDGILEVSGTPKFTAAAIQYLEDNIFGVDQATVVDIRRNTVKEITPDHFKRLRKGASLVAERQGPKGRNLVFTNTTNGVPVFHLRTKLRPPPANEAKFYIEVKDGAYA